METFAILTSGPNLTDSSLRLKLIHSGWRADSVTELGETQRVVRDRMSNGWFGLVAQALAKLA